MKTNAIQISKLNLFELVTPKAKNLRAKENSLHLKWAYVLKLSSYTAIPSEVLTFKQSSVFRSGASGAQWEDKIRKNAKELVVLCFK